MREIGRECTTTRITAHQSCSVDLYSLARSPRALIFGSLSESLRRINTQPALLGPTKRGELAMCSINPFSGFIRRDQELSPTRWALLTAQAHNKARFGCEAA